MDFLSAWIVSPSALPFLCLIWGTLAQQAFRTEPKNLTVRMGDTAVLKCEVLRASGTVQWVKDGLLLGPQRSLPGFPRYSMIGNTKRGQYHLRIEKAQLEDDASYECQAAQSESSTAIISSTAWLTVEIPPSKPYLMMDISTPWVSGKKYNITCIAPDAKPVAEITLFKDGVELTGAKFSTTSGSKDKLLNRHAQVTFIALGSDNGRPLTCHASNKALFRPVETAMTMSVYFPPPPPVILGLERKEVKAGRILMVECVSHGGNPLAALQWTKDGDVLSKTWQEDVVGHKSTSVLRFKITPADNQALLSCESTHPASLSPVSVSKQITVLFEPAEVTLSGSLTAIEGEDLNLSCHAASSNPPVQIRWWLGHMELNTSVVTMEEGDNGGKTTMSNMTYRVSREEDGLELTCEAFNKGTHFSKTQNAKLSVYYPPQRIWLSAPPQEVPLRSGNEAHLICFSSGGNPTGTLTWFKNGKVVPYALKQTSSDRGVARELVLVLTASDNMATYRCDATNEAGKTISAHTKLMVHYPAVSIKITTKQEELRQGQMLTLECQSGSSNPKANIVWSLGTLRFQGVEEPPVNSVFGGVSVRSFLYLNLSSQHHNMMVICQAHSPGLAELASTFLTLNVLYPPEFGPGQPTQVQVLENDMVTIPLQVTANPEEVSCIWRHHGRKVVKEGGLYYNCLEDNSLQIENVTRKNAGVYTVKCTNDEGVNQTSIMLDVQYAPGVKAEKDHVFVNLGETADLICVADANPIISDMFSWKFLGEPGDSEMDLGEENQHDESSLLTIYNVTRAHAGLYQCTADNGIAPPATVDVELVVQFKPQLLKGAQWRKVASRGDGTAIAELVCRAEGIPRVDFSWKKNNVRMDFENPRYEERTVRDGSFYTSTIRVVNVSALLDYAVFSCTARNSLGEDKLDIQLVSTSHPDPPSSFRKVAVTHNSVTLEWIPGFNGGLQQRFRIRYRWSQSDSFLYMDVFPPRETTFTVTALQPATTYNFSVNALNAMGESGYADNNAVLTITTKERPEVEEVPTDDDSVSQRLPAYLTVVFTVVFGVILVFNSLGCFFGVRWKRRRGQTGGRGGSMLDGKKNGKEGSSQSTVSNSNKYESREKINTAAQRTLLIDSGSETDSNVYESYAAESSHYYYPTGDYMPPLSPHPEEICRFDVAHLPADHHSHLYEAVRDGGPYQDVKTCSLSSPPPLFDLRLPHQSNEWRPPTHHQGTERAREFMDVRQPLRDSDLPFELRGELV